MHRILIYLSIHIVQCQINFFLNKKNVKGKLHLINFSKGLYFLADKLKRTRYQLSEKITGTFFFFLLIFIYSF